MTYEIDFLPVGDPGEDGKCCRSGDAIALRYGNLNGPRAEQAVVVIDGGFNSSGQALVQHVKRWYGTDIVDIVVSSHPHDDHIQGLFPVLEQLRVRTLLMHKPWDHAAAVTTLLNDDRVTHAGSKRRLKESFRAALDLHGLAIRKGINVVEPFQGLQTDGGNLLVLGPSIALYRHLLSADLDDRGVADIAGVGIVARGLAAIGRVFAEAWDAEALTEPSPNAVEPLNHTSTVIHFSFGNTTALFTADAGVLALNHAVDFAELQGIDVKKCARVQVPHHGSKRNVGPLILNRLLGPILPHGTPAGKTAKLSAAKDGAPKHPSGRVTNAFHRRGAPVCGSRGISVRWSSPDAPRREGWTNVDSIPFRDSYDEDDD